MSTNDDLPKIDRDAARYELWNRIAVWCKSPRGAGVEVAADAIDEELDTMLQAYAREAVEADRARPINVVMRMKLRHLVDLTTQYVTESEMVLATETIDRLIAQAMEDAPTMGAAALQKEQT